METAAEKLGTVPTDVETGTVVDLSRLGIDLDGDGAITPAESTAAIMADMTSRGSSALSGPLVFRFDRADGYWLQGYAEFPDGAGRFLAGA